MSFLSLRAVRPAAMRLRAVTSMAYKKSFQEAAEDPAGFWGQHAKAITWTKPFETVR